MIHFLYALQTCCWIVLLAHLDDENNCAAAIDLGTIALGLRCKIFTAFATCWSMATRRVLWDARRKNDATVLLVVVSITTHFLIARYNWFSMGQIAMLQCTMVCMQLVDFFF